MCPQLSVSIGNMSTLERNMLIKPFHDSFWAQWERTGFIFSQITQFVSQCLIIYPLTHGRKTLTMKLVNCSFMQISFSYCASPTMCITLHRSVRYYLWYCLWCILLFSRMYTTSVNAKTAVPPLSRGICAGNDLQSQRPLTLCSVSSDAC